LSPLNELQHKNIREIDGLNQRGGRTLSFVDLIEAGTMSPELIAHCWTAIAHGASFLTAAGPSGAGKSTVLANLLVLLPPDEEIVTVTDPAIVDDNCPNCYLAHEIGSGHWYGYIWGRQVRDFFALMPQGRRIASCLHADELDEAREILTSPPLQVPVDHVSMLDLLLLVKVVPPMQRRVVAAYESTGQGHRLAFSYDEAMDEIIRHGDSELFARLGATEDEYQAKLALVNQFVDEEEARFDRVREKVLATYGDE